LREKRFCPYCGRRGEDIYRQGRKRLYCGYCKEILYENPLPAVAALVEEEDNKLLMVKRSVEPAQGKWALPGGFIETDEELEEAASRELKEETGLKGRVKELVGVSYQLSQFWGKSIIVIGYWIETFDGVLKPGDDASDVKYFDINDLPPIPFSSHERLIEEFKRMKRPSRQNEKLQKKLDR